MLKKVRYLKLLLRTAAINCGPFKNSHVKGSAGRTQSIAAILSGIKCALSVVFLSALLFTANVSYGFAVLWWAVGESATVTDENNQTVLASAYTSPDGETIGAARVRMTGDGVNMLLPQLISDGEGGWTVSPTGEYTDELLRDGSEAWTGADWVSVRVDGDPSQYSFVVELGSVDENGSWVNTLAVTDPQAWSNLNNYITYGDVSTPPPYEWMANAFTVPEPSVAMLLLLGAELLAFRRGRRKAVPRQRV